MHFAKHTEYASEQTCKLVYFEPHPSLSIRSLNAACPISEFSSKPTPKNGAQLERNSIFCHCERSVAECGNLITKGDRFVAQSAPRDDTR